MGSRYSTLKQSKSEDIKPTISIERIYQETLQHNAKFDYFISQYDSELSQEVALNNRCLCIQYHITRDFESQLLTQYGKLCEAEKLASLEAINSNPFSVLANDLYRHQTEIGIIRANAEQHLFERNIALPNYVPENNPNIGIIKTEN